MDITVEICEAAPAGRSYPNTLILHASELKELAHYAALVPSRQINWAQTFARRGLRHEDYELKAEEGPCSYSFTRRTRACSSLPAAVTLRGRETPAYSDATLQGDCLTYLIEEPVLSFMVCHTREFAVNCRVNEEFPDGVKTLIGDYGVARGLSWHLRGKGAAERFIEWLAKCWDPKCSFLQVEPSDIPF